MAEIGRVGVSGVNRQAFSTEDIRARQLLCNWAIQLGLHVFTDAVANLFFRYQPEGALGSPVLTGSHADSQPSGGRFDGIYGVLAGLEAVQAIQESGLKIQRPLEVVVWSNEEGSRFAPGAMGSMVFTGLRKVEEFLDKRDINGVVLRDELQRCLAATPFATNCGLYRPVAAYIEAHIEQGPVLEEAKKTIGLVTGIQGCRWFEVTVTGAARHAGSTPMGTRKDALQESLAIIKALGDMTRDMSDRTRFTVGRFDVIPNSPNTIPAQVSFSVDLRHPEKEILKELGDLIETTAHESVRSCSVTVDETFTHSPVTFPESITTAIAKAVANTEYSSMSLPSGAFHDAMFLSDHCPSGMIFVPSKDGISHHPDESSTPTDLAAGAQVLAHALYLLAS
jgi:N-carbamoyl-L-amino-acid hydrolase